MNSPNDTAETIAGRIIYTIAYVLGLVIGYGLEKSWTDVIETAAIFIIVTIMFIYFIDLKPKRSRR